MRVIAVTAPPRPCRRQQFLPFASYYGPGGAAESRLASLVARALTPWTDPALHNQTLNDG